MSVINAVRRIYGFKSVTKPLFALRTNNLFQSVRLGPYSTNPPTNRKGILKVTLIGASFGAILGVGYSGYTHYTINQTKELAFNVNKEPIILKQPPVYKPTRKIQSVTDSSELQLVLFQYQTCPFCCKVRAFLDSNGLSYEIVEVDAVLRQSIKWSSYKKVPILLAKTKNGFVQLNDSSTIISALSSYLLDTSQDLSEVMDYYPSMSVVDEKGNSKDEVLNKYFLMFRDLQRTKSHEKLNTERVWRRWTDEVLVHTLSPNVYRTMDEAYQAFNWFADVGEWRENFPKWECDLMINVGAFAMWLIGKRLKKRHGLKGDVRESLYDECRYWMRSISENGTRFMGGLEPDLSDMAVYGVLSSIKGCDAFKDLVDNTNINIWFSAMEEHINNHKGQIVN